MTSLSAILAAIEASTEKIKTLEADLAAERENGKTLVEQYRAQSADALKTLGIVDRRSREFDTRESKGPILGALGRSDFARVRYCSRIACKSR
jgi:hypothetical protein